MFRNLKKKIQKFQLEQEVKNRNFLAALVLFLPLHPCIFKSTNIFFFKFTYLGRSQRVESIPKISKNLEP